VFPPLGDIVAKFLCGVGIAMEHELTRLLADEKLAIQNVPERAIGRCPENRMIAFTESSRRA